MNTDAATDDGSEYGCQLATDGLGAWIAVWPGSGGALSYDGDVLFSRSTDNGATWSSPASIDPTATTDAIIDRNPQIVTDGSGVWIVVWSHGYDLNQSTNTDYDIHFSRSLDAGSSWSAPAALNTNALTDVRVDETPRIATDGIGSWIAIWAAKNDTLNQDYNILIARSNDDGTTWSAPDKIDIDAALNLDSEYNPDIAADGQGNWIGVWELHAGEDTDLVHTQSADDGLTWSVPTYVNANTGILEGDDENPRITTDRAGVWNLVWSSSQRADNPIFADFDVVTSRSTDTGQTWTVPAAVNSDSLEWGFHRRPDITTDEQGMWVVVWESQGALGQNGLESDVMTAGSVDNGATWTPIALLNSGGMTDSGYDNFAQVATDRSGQWIAVWSTSEEIMGAGGTDSDILYLRASTFVPVSHWGNLLAAGLLMLTGILATGHRKKNRA